MTIKRNILIMLVGAIIVFLLIGLCAVLLFYGISKLGDTEKELVRKKTAHENFYKKDPFPSKQNAEQERKNVEALEEAIGKLAGSLKVGEVKAFQTTPSAFMSLLGSKRKELAGIADQSGVINPPNFAFGFERYCAPDSPLPPPAELPVLSQQLTIIEQVCVILFKGKAKEITKITRDELDNPGSSVAPAGAGKNQDKPLFTKLHFVFEFKAKENSIVDILDRIASSKIFMVVTSLKFDKEGSDILDAQSGSAPAGGGLRRSGSEFDDEPLAPIMATNAPVVVSDKSLPRSKRVMSGPKMEKPMKARMSLEVYKFAEE